MLGGDRLLAATLRLHVEASPQVHARLYTGRAGAAEVLFVGSSRSREHFPAGAIARQTGRSSLNLGWGGLSSEQVEAILLDYIDRYGAPEIVVLEVTSPEIDQLMLRNLRLFEADSPRIDALVAAYEPVLHAAGRLLALLRYNNKLFFDMVRYDLDDTDYRSDRVIDPAELARLRHDDNDWSYRDADVAVVGQLLRTARARGIEVVPVITPILPAYLDGLSGFADWRDAVARALPADVHLWDFSGAVGDPAGFRDDLHLNARGVAIMLERMRAAGMPGLVT
ncbi:MAG: hypothetical protein U1E14_02525 [Geminicoccaceae bacterium]